MSLGGGVFFGGKELFPANSGGFRVWSSPLAKTKPKGVTPPRKHKGNTHKNFLCGTYPQCPGCLTACTLGTDPPPLGLPRGASFDFRGHPPGWVVGSPWVNFFSIGPNFPSGQERDRPGTSQLPQPFVYGGTHLFLLNGDLSLGAFSPYPPVWVFGLGVL